MRSLLLCTALAGALFASTAHAQFANRSIGASAGYMNLGGQNGFDWAVPVGLSWSQYLDAGFDFIIRANGMLMTDFTGKQAIGVTGAPGIRYSFLQESFRPYAGLDIAYLHIFLTDAQSNAIETNYVGIGPNLGVQWFLNDAWSIGLRLQYNVYVMLNAPITTSYSLTFEVATWY